MTEFTLIVSICSGVMTIFGLLVFLVKPIRERILKIKERDERQNKRIDGLEQLSMASSLNSMTRIYYEAMEKGEIRQYHYESFCNTYAIYKALGGNHWSQKMYDDLQNIKVIPN